MAVRQAVHQCYAMSFLGCSPICRDLRLPLREGLFRGFKLLLYNPILTVLAKKILRFLLTRSILTQSRHSTVIERVLKMRSLHIIPFVLATLASITLAKGFRFDCNHDAGCVRRLLDKISAWDIESYKTRVVSRHIFRSSCIKIDLVKLDTVRRPLHDFGFDPERKLPSMCRASSYRNYRSFVDKRKFDKQSKPANSKADCCLLCRTVGDCFSFEFDTSKSQCNYYTSAEKVDATSESTVCPSGLGSGYLEMENYPAWPGHYGHEMGPCLSTASKYLKKAGRLDLQGFKDTFDQEILNLPKDGDVDDDEFVEL